MKTPTPASLEQIDAALAYVDRAERDALAELLRTTPGDDATERARRIAYDELERKLDATRDHLRGMRVVARMGALL